MTYTVPKGLDYIQRWTTNCDIAQCDFRIAKAGFNTCVACLEARVSMSWRLITVRVSEGQSVCIINEEKLAHFTALCSAWDYLKTVLGISVSIICLNSAMYRSERCKLMSLFFSFLHLHLMHKLSVKSISRVRVEWGTNAGVNYNTIQTFPHASITEFTISLPYHHYIEKKMCQS